MQNLVPFDSPRICSGCCAVSLCPALLLQGLLVLIEIAIDNSSRRKEPVRVCGFSATEI